MTMKKFAWSATTIIILLLAAFIYWRFYFVYSEGAKAGILNTFQQKGFVFKTYEGKLIQSGIKSRQTGTLQNNEFEFSVTDESIAKQMMGNSGKFYELHYKEYKSSLPWRGFSRYVVDSVYAAKDVQSR